MSVSLRRWLSRLGPTSVGALLIVMLSLLVIQGCTSSDLSLTSDGQGGNQSALPPAPKVGRRAPDFILADLAGNQVRLSDFRGKTVLVYFWATWCPGCRAEMPKIEAVYQKYKDRDVVVIGVDLREPEDEVRQFVQRAGYSWTFVIDPSGVVARDYRITVIPTSFFMDRDGVIRAVHVGGASRTAIEDNLLGAMR